MNPDGGGGARGRAGGKARGHDGPHLLPVRDPAPEVAELLAGMPQRHGKPLNVFATLAHHPRLLKRMNVFGGLFLAHSTIPLRQREIVILRAAWRAGSVYEFGQHTLIGRDAGLTSEEIAALGGAPHAWSAADRLLVEATDQIHAQARLDGATWSKLQGAYGDLSTIELIFLAGFYRMLAGFLTTVGVEPDEGVPGWPVRS
jgi:4-carboxymuconolactone decarboxylase